MNESDDRIARLADALVNDRRPPRFLLEDEEVRELLVAFTLLSARPRTGYPTQEFLEHLKREFEKQVRATDRRVWPRQVSRRRVLQAASLAAAAVAGMGIDRIALRTSHPEAVQDELVPAAGRWVAVAMLDALPQGAVQRYSAGAVKGFVIRSGRGVNAVSAVCTHLGCILRFNETSRRLDCPCHGASFAMDGTPLSKLYLRPLPRLRSRTRSGLVEVDVDRSS